MNTHIEVVIEKLVQGGAGLARNEGKVVFVEGALPGERVQCTLLDNKRDFMMASVDRLIEASPLRVTPLCPYYEMCGGCDFQHVAGPAQPVFKLNLLTDNLLRLGKIDYAKSIPIAGAEQTAYRSRARIHVDPATERVGFLGKRSASLIAIDHCPVLVEGLQAFLGVRKKELLRHAATFQSFSRTGGRSARYPSVHCAAGTDNAVIGQQETSATVGGITYTFDAEVFFQSNLLVMPAMMDFVKKHILGPVVLDLYSGVGTFAAIAGGIAETVFAVERETHCLAYARQNLENYKHVEFFTEPAERWALSHKGLQPDTVIVDPPRGGLHPMVIDTILGWKPERLIYVSCSSDTFSRDLRRCIDGGYSIMEIEAFDFYPQTAHLEMAAVLVKNG